MGIIGRHVKLLIAAGTFFSLMIYSAIFIGVPLLAFGWFLLYHTDEIKRQEKYLWFFCPIVIVFLSYCIMYVLYLVFS